MNFKFCPECGYKFDREYKFCPQCGYKLGEPAAAQTRREEEPARLTAAELREIEAARKLFFDDKYAEAAEAVRKYAERGNAEAQFILGTCYDGSCNFTPLADPKETVYWYQKAADRGHAYAMCMLGQCYDGGYGVPEDREKTLYWWRKAADLGNDQAILMLDGLEAQEHEEKPEKRVPKSQEEADLMHAEECYDHKQFEEAFTISKKYAEMGVAKAQTLLGWCYDNYAHKTPYYDPEKAVYWYRKAAAQGDTDAMCNLGLCYLYGRGVPEDHAKAREWYQKAYDLGNQGGKDLLDDMDYFGD